MEHLGFMHPNWLEHNMNIVIDPRDDSLLGFRPTTLHCTDTTPTTTLYAMQCNTTQIGKPCMSPRNTWMVYYEDSTCCGWMQSGVGILKKTMERCGAQIPILHSQRGREISARESFSAFQWSEFYLIMRNQMDFANCLASIYWMMMDGPLLAH